MDNRKTRVGALLAVAAAGIVGAMATGNAQAATINMTTSDAVYSWNTAMSGRAYWGTPGAVATAGNDYVVGSGFMIRTPNATASLTFVGSSLTVNGSMQFDGADAQAITVNNLTLGSGAYIQGSNNNSLRGNASLNGSLTVTGTGITSATASNLLPLYTKADGSATTFTINSSITGSGASVLRWSQGGRPAGASFVLSGVDNTNTFSGLNYLENSLLTVTTPGALGAGNLQLVNPTSAKLTLTSATNNPNFIGDGADLILPAGLVAGSITLNFTGTDTIGRISFDGGTTWATGTFGAAGSGATNENAVFTGSGLLAVPEPATLGLLSLAGLAMLRRRHA